MVKFFPLLHFSPSFSHAHGFLCNTVRHARNYVAIDTTARFGCGDSPSATHALLRRADHAHGFVGDTVAIPAAQPRWKHQRDIPTGRRALAGSMTRPGFYSRHCRVARNYVAIDTTARFGCGGSPLLRRASCARSFLCNIVRHARGPASMETSARYPPPAGGTRQGFQISHPKAFSFFLFFSILRPPVS